MSCTNEYIHNPESGQCEQGLCNTYAHLGNCIDCSDYYTCVLCDSGSFLNDSDICELCPENCTLCDSEVSCTDCIPDYEVRASEDSEHLCAPICTDGYYSEYLLCERCPLSCSLCDSATKCTSCSGSFSLITYSNGNVLCEEECGDYVVYSSPCDLGKGNAAYGCSDNCQVEDHFTCETVNSSSNCYFSGTFELELASIEKEMFANSITVQYTLSPVLKYFQDHDPSDFMYIVDQPDFESPSFSFDYDTGRVSLNFTYSQDIEGGLFKL